MHNAIAHHSPIDAQLVPELQSAPPGQLPPVYILGMMSYPVYKVGGVGWEGQIAAQELTGHRSASGEQLHCAPLALYSLILLVLLLSLIHI